MNAEVGFWEEYQAGKAIAALQAKLALRARVKRDGTDQSALTGDSLPVELKPGDVVYSGSIVKQGDAEALVFGGGQNTYFGKTAHLVESAHTVGQLFYLGERVFHIGREMTQSLMYLKLLVAGHLTICATRTRRPFWSIRPAAILFWVVVPIVGDINRCVRDIYGANRLALGGVRMWLCPRLVPFQRPREARSL